MRLRSERAGGWRPPDLTSQVACVTGASYGIGRGVAEVLGQCGATVYVTARSTRGDATRADEWTVDETAALVVAREYGFTDIDGRIPDDDGDV